MNGHQSLQSLLNRIVAASRRIDIIVKNECAAWVTNWELDDAERDLVQQAAKRLPFDISQSAEHYLENEDSLYFWEPVFKDEFRALQNDESSYLRMNSWLERLAGPAEELEICGTEVVFQYRNLPNVPEARVQGIILRQKAVMGFLESYNIGIELWIHENQNKFPGYFVFPHRRHIRKLFQDNPVLLDGPQAGRAVISSEPTGESRSSPLSAFANTISILSVTSLLVIASAVLQTQAFDMTFQTDGRQPGRTTQPDFYAILQSALMQLLGLYTTILPVLRHRTVTYPWWTWTFAAGSFLCSVSSIGLYFWFAALAPLVAFFGSCLQALMVLQLVWLIDENTTRRIVAKKKSV